MPDTSTVSSTMPPRELTLIVAATTKMGIGLNGTLPWTGLKKEMAYFARVTKRVSDTQNHNAVIMGRKTWESIPPRFRPLKDRTNIVISRSFSNFQQKGEVGKEYYEVGSLEGAVRGLESVGRIEKAFVIGGGQIYRAALEMEEAKRILLTRILDDFECDTVFAVDLKEEDGGEENGGWVKRGKDELDTWVGETVTDGVQVEGEKQTRYIFEMWERENV